MRRFRYAMQTRQYVNQQTATRKTENPAPSKKQPADRSTKQERVTPALLSDDAQPMIRPVDLAWHEVGVYPLITVLLGVVGVYFAVWLAKGGAQELAFWFTWR